MPEGSWRRRIENSGSKRRRAVMKTYSREKTVIDLFGESTKCDYE